MANEEQVTILHRSVKGWNQWREENPEIRPNLFKTNLSRVNLGNANLNSANLNSAKLSGANLSRVDLTGANLTGANLINANLINANLNSANLNSAKLSFADLTGANLTGANLINANLFDVDLSDANLNDANLINANLNDANLSDANLSDANLNGADFSRARIGGTVFGDVDLSEAKGLETVQHGRPSTIGIDTIYKSKGQIPEIFLRGCGIPDIFIEYMNALTSKPFDFHHCYIGYSPGDEAFATRLHDTLQGKGVRCWTMEKNARLGDYVTSNIERGIRLTDKLLVCCSKESLNNGWINFEIRLALDQEIELQQGDQSDVWRIIPLDLDGHLFSPEYSGKVSSIRNRTAGDFTNWKSDSDKFDQQVAKVIQAIRLPNEGLSS